MDLSNPGAPLTQLTSGVDGAMDFQYSAYLGAFVEVSLIRHTHVSPCAYFGVFVAVGELQTVLYGHEQWPLDSGV
jgi:hypothetical protein